MLAQVTRSEKRDVTVEMLAPPRTDPRKLL
jgi:hypothetical protein